MAEMKEETIYQSHLSWMIWNPQTTYSQRKLYTPLSNQLFDAKVYIAGGGKAKVIMTR